MRLVVGLGNPGPDYVGTRHNVGFAVLDALAVQHSLGEFKNSKRAAIVRGQLARWTCLLAKPSTFMNHSGEAVSALLRFYRIEPADLLVVHDELDFDPGQVRIKLGGGHGGHNGLRNILQHLGGQDFARVRVGIGKPARASGGAAYVLARFEPASLQAIAEAVDRACRAVEIFVTHGLAPAMQAINTSSPPPAGAGQPA